VSFTPQSVFDEYEDRLEQLRSVNGSLAADLIEARRERDEARDEVVRLGRERDEALADVDRLDDVLGEARQQIIRDAKELVRLRTIIVELGAGEAAEPEPIDITPLLLKHPPGPVTLASLIAQPEEQIEALRQEDA
jgi:chromosome segregation ATPase